MKNLFTQALMLIIIVILLYRLNTIENKIDCLADTVLQSGEAVVTEIYRYAGG